MQHDRSKELLEVIRSFELLNVGCFTVFLKKNQTKPHKTTDKKTQTNNETSPKNQNTENNPTPNKQTSPKPQQTCNSNTAAIPLSWG